MLINKCAYLTLLKHSSTFKIFYLNLKLSLLDSFLANPSKQKFISGIIHSKNLKKIARKNYQVLECIYMRVLLSFKKSFILNTR